MSPLQREHRPGKEDGGNRRLFGSFCEGSMDDASRSSSTSFVATRLFIGGGREGESDDVRDEDGDSLMTSPPCARRCLSPSRLCRDDVEPRDAQSAVVGSNDEKQRAKTGGFRKEGSSSKTHVRRAMFCKQEKARKRQNIPPMPQVMPLSPTEDGTESSVSGEDDLNTSRIARRQQHKKGTDPDEEIDEDTIDTSHECEEDRLARTSSKSTRKRPSGYQQAGREDIDDHEDLFFLSSAPTSPQANKNPFSPVVPPPTTSKKLPLASKRRQAQDFGRPPSPPMMIDTVKSFESHDGSVGSITTASTVGSNAAPVATPAPPLPSPAHFTFGLQHRRGGMSMAEGHQVRQHHQYKEHHQYKGYFYGNNSGFPDRHGRYSFTGSPIEEIDIVSHIPCDSEGRVNDITDTPGGRTTTTATSSCWGVGSKIRRLNLEDNDDEDSYESSHTSLSTTAHKNRLVTKNREKLFVDVSEDDNDPTVFRMNDEISPTDVMAFPQHLPGGSPSKKSACNDGIKYPTIRSPPAPRKKIRQSSVESQQPVTTALRGPPETPMVQRRNAAISRLYRDDTDSEDEWFGTVGGSRRTGGPIGRTRHRKDHSEVKRATMVKSRFNEDFQIVGTLGNGSFGTVYKCLSRLDGCMYAVKAAKRKAKGIADRDRMLKEVYALAALCDQADTAAFHIVRYHQAWMEENRLYIQTELCSSTLHEEMMSGPLNEKRRYKVLREMLLALELIHRNDMVHLDIKPENIFLKTDQFKLGDFGLVSKITNNDDVEEGDSRYMSMELLSGNHKDLTKSDIFSLGATMYEICLGRTLPSDGEEWQNIRAGILFPMPDTPRDLQLLIKEMLHPNPDARPSAKNLLKRRPLLSDEQKQLIAEKNKVLEANMALQVQQERLKKISPPKRQLTRANTWTGNI